MTHLTSYVTSLAVPLDDVALLLLKTYQEAANGFKAAFNNDPDDEETCGNRLSVQFATGREFVRHMQALAVNPLFNSTHVVHTVTITIDGKNVTLKRAVRKAGFSVMVLRAYDKQQKKVMADA
jgi:hypothetical protein